MTLATHGVENILEEQLNITNPISVRTDNRSNLNLNMINNVILAEMDEHTEEAE